MLARTVAHTVDVSGMLDDMFGNQFDEWWAEWHIEPWGDEAKQTAMICAELHNAINLGINRIPFVNAGGVKHMTHKRFMPRFRFAKPGEKKKKRRNVMAPSPNRMSNRAAEAALAYAFGGGR